MISVVIVTKNERPIQLRKCIKALSNQTFRDFELVIVVPKDVAPSISLPNKLDVQIVNQNGKGICNARNCGIKTSSGEIIAFTDDDAEPYPNWLQKISQRFRENPSLDYVGGEFTLDQKTLWQYWINNRYHLSEIDINRGLCHGNNMAYKKRVFKDNLFDEGIIFGADESEFQTRLHKQGFKGTTFQDILIKHNHRTSFLQFTKMRWMYAQGKVFLHEKDDRELFHWTDLMNIGFFTSLFYALIAYTVPFLFVFPTFLFGLIFLHERKRKGGLILHFLDVYVSILWTLSKMYYSFKRKWKKWLS